MLETMVAFSFKGYHKMLSIVFFAIIIFSSVSADNELPSDFIVGFATASYQVEGAWNEDGKGENTWDRFTHEKPESIVDGSNGDVAADEYHKLLEDIQYLSAIGAQTYRFSLSWSRIFPDGRLSSLNPDGVAYYFKVIDTLLLYNITPAVTLFHWDLPQKLQDLGGWPNPILADYFEDYARAAFTLFGDKVKFWITFNEPFETCYSSYGISEKAPGLNMPGVADYLCAHTLIYAHARAYHLYNDTFRATQKGVIGITLNGGWNEPASDDPADILAADTINSFQIGWFADPIFSKTGDYPEIMRTNIDKNSANEGLLRSRLPQWDQETVEYIRGTYDFYGLNHYTTFYATPQQPPEGPTPSWQRDCAVKGFQDPSWPSSGSSWLKVVPFGMRRILNYIKDKYDNPTVFITENGFSDLGELEDDDRINYHNSYLQEILNAINEDGCKVAGYYAWSLLDNFEWARGYTEKFGIIQVDFNDPTRPRKLKKSAGYFKDLLKQRKLPIPVNGTWLFSGFDV